MGALERVLLLDDDEDLRLVATMALESLGQLQVMGCGSPEEAIEALGRFKPDLMLLDVELPGMDGPAVLRQLRARPDSADLPVVFLTARTHPQDLKRLRELGAADIISKPFDPMELSQQVRSIWERLR